MKAIIFDTETTGIDAPELVEAAWLPVGPTGAVVEPGGWCGRFKPSKPISFGALATHHIMDEDLADAPPSTSFELPEGVEYLIGHNIDFDWQVIGKPDVGRICTLAMSRAIWPDVDSHSLGAMLYLIDRKTARERLANAHSAAVDTVNCALLLRAIVQHLGPSVDTFESLWKASEEMRIPTKMTFGKYKDVAIKDIPRDYKQWLLRQPDVDPYLVMALQA